MATLFHIGPKGFNVGNHAIGVGVHQMLREAFHSEVNIISLPAAAKYEVDARAGLTAKIVHEINQYGDGVIVGGGNMLENGEFDIDINAMNALAPPMLVISVSWGRIYNRQRKLVRRTDSMTDERVKALYQKADYFLARDDATGRHLAALGAQNPIVGGCPTTTLASVRNTLPQISNHAKGVALLSVRNPNLMNIPLEIQSRTRDDVERLADLLSNRFGAVRLLCHDHRDIPFAATFSKYEYIYTADVREYLALLAQCSINVTYRLHSALPSLALGRPFVKLSYDERSLSLMETIGLAEWNIDIVQESEVVSQVTDRIENLDKLAKIIAKTEPIRDDLHARMRHAMTSFSDDVRTYSTKGYY